MLGVGKQYNIVVVAARGHHLREMTNLPDKLQATSQAVGQQAKFRFSAAEKAAKDFIDVSH